MKISKQAKRDAKQLLTSCREHGVLQEQRVRLAVQQVIAKKPRGYVAILQHFHRLVGLDIARRTARVESAGSLSAEQQSEVRTNLTRRYGQGLFIGFNENPALLGGLRIQVGSDVFDSSVRARLDSLAGSF